MQVETPTARPAASGDAATRQLPVAGMTCASCVRAVEQAIRSVPDVREASVNFATATASVRLAPRPEALRKVVTAVHQAGYEVRRGRSTLELPQLWDGAAAERAESALRAVPGVLEVSVSLATNEAQVEHLALPELAGLLRDALRGAGFEARLRSDGTAVDAEAEG